jgi:hypothetical protein
MFITSNAKTLWFHAVWWPLIISKGTVHAVEELGAKGCPQGLVDDTLDEVDGLVGQEAVADVAVGELGGKL